MVEQICVCVCVCVVFSRSNITPNWHEESMCDTNVCACTITKYSLICGRGDTCFKFSSHDFKFNTFFAIKYMNIAIVFFKKKVTKVSHLKNTLKY